MADIRGIPISDVFGRGLLTATQSAPSGFTPGQNYLPLAVAVDSAVTPPLVYLLTANDNGQLAIGTPAQFTFQVQKFLPGRL